MPALLIAICTADKIEFCTNDGRPCYVGAGTKDARWRCGTSHCGSSPAGCRCQCELCIRSRRMAWPGNSREMMGAGIRS